MDYIRRNKFITGHLNDPIISDKINQFLIKNNVFYCYREYCGSGAEGEAYKVHDYYEIFGVMKITTRRLEYLISNHLKDKDFKHLYKTIDNCVLIPNSLYLIYKPYYIIDNFIEKIKGCNIVELRANEQISQQLVEMTNEFRYFGNIEDFDLHGGNIGWDGENLVHFDIDESPYGCFQEEYFL